MSIYIFAQKEKIAVGRDKSTQDAACMGISNLKRGYDFM